MSFLPYSRQIIDEEDIRSVVDVLRSDFLTTGPAVSLFEQMVCAYAGVKHGVAVSSGTAALHAAMYSIGIGPGDEVIVPAMTFAATSNSVLYCGGTPVFADVEENTLLINPTAVEKAITLRTKAIVAVDYAGQPCDWDSLRAIADKHGVTLVADACHSIGGKYKGRNVGTLADISVFSFHPVKNMTTGEGGMCVTDNSDFSGEIRTFRNHGITTDARQRESAGAWFYEMTELGFNYRITDIQCALGASQLKKLDKWVERRNMLAGLYDAAFAGSAVRPLVRRKDLLHAYHLYVVRHPDRDEVFKRLRAEGIGANVHYIPVHLHPYYRNKLGTREGLCPVAEKAYREIISLPLWPGMTDADVKRIVLVVSKS